ncbi:SLC13 family permease [Sphingorhabdus sp. 109]|jgi:di/tricarboxylate transporter|uniref:SLC13 family permease n=1 Tax=Sphingorhabdus sp. 109 TaxID=2653173 RepID=UPI0012F1EBDF|nr:SLC13 family permease [Sphingorhabdus sp. 109]VWX57899.1 dATP pyrophosphohydrolase [Sphingorhabdus sp. 109]
MLAVLAPHSPALVALILFLLLIAFATEIRPPEVTAIGAAGLLLVLGLISTDDILVAMSNPAPLTIAAMFIISGALVRTGTLEAFALRVTGLAKASPVLATGLLLVAIAILSGFTNNTPLVMMMIPIGITLAKELGDRPSKILMPISFAAILGGTCTLIGTSTNILVDGVAQKNGMTGFSIFEIAPAGIIIAIVGVTYLALTRRFLPDRDTMSSLLDENESKRYTMSIFIGVTSPYLGQIASDIDLFRSGERRLVDVIRNDAPVRTALSEYMLRQGDVLVLNTHETDVMTIRERGKLPLINSDDPYRFVPMSSHRSMMAEILLLPGAHLIGQTLKEAALSQRYGVQPIAMHRRGSKLPEQYDSTKLQVGDTLLLEGAKTNIRRLVQGENLMNVSEPKTRGYRRHKAPIAIAVILAAVFAAALDIMPIAGLAVLGMAAVLVTRCIEPDEAFASVDWRIIGLIVAMLAIGTALENAGLVEMLVQAATPWLSGFPPVYALAAIYLLSLLLTELVTNNAVAVVVTPIAIQLAISLGVDPRPFVVAVMFAASASFLTPIGYQTNTLVYSAGGYRFLDFARYGLPLTLVIAVTSITIIPLIWPL